MLITTNYTSLKENANLTDEQKDIIDTLADEIQKEVDAIPCLKNLNLEFNIFNIRFDEEENPIFDIKIDNTVIHDVTGEYDTRYYHLYDWQESEQIGSQIAKILVDIAKNKANVNLEFLEDIRGDFDFTRRGESWREGYNNYYECLSTSNEKPFKYYVDFNKDDDNVVYFNGRMSYFDVKTNEDVQKFLQECQDGLYSEVNQKSYSFDKEKILDMIAQEVTTESGAINNFWDFYEQEAKQNFPSTQFDYMLDNLEEKDYIIIARKGKDFYVMPAITGEEDNLSFQRIMSEDEKAQITKNLKNMQEDIIYSALEQIKEKLNNFLETKNLDEIIAEKKQQKYNDFEDDILNSLTEIIQAQNNKDIHL